MELIYDIIIRNVPDVMRSLDLFLRRLKDRAREEGLSDVLLCLVTPGANGRPELGSCRCKTSQRTSAFYDGREWSSTTAF